MGTTFESGTGATTGAGAPLGSALDAGHRPRRAVAATYQRMADQDRGTGGESLSDFLGYFSLGLGLAEALMPSVMARVVGIDHEDARNRNVMRLMGLREISHGIAVLSHQQPEKAVWSRVAGDALDLALLGRALSNPKNDRGRTIFATANVLAVAALDVMCARLLSKQPETAANAGAGEGIIQTKRSVTVACPVEEAYALWHDFERLPRFMRHLESVTVTGDGRSHWVAKAPAGKRVEWDAETTEDVPNQRIAWRSLPGSDVYNAGTVEFRAAPGNRGTEVRVIMEYKPPLGTLGAKVAMLWRQEPGQQVEDDLRHFKQVLELGDIVVSDATKDYGMHPAAPDGEPAHP